MLLGSTWSIMVVVRHHDRTVEEGQGFRSVCPLCLLCVLCTTLGIFARPKIPVAAPPSLCLSLCSPSHLCVLYGYVPSFEPLRCDVFKAHPRTEPPLSPVPPRNRPTTAGVGASLRRWRWCR